MTIQTSKTSTTLEYIKTIGIVTNIAVGRGFAHPVGIAVSNDGRIFVLNRAPTLSASRIGVCNFDEEYLYDFGSHGEGDGQFTHATAIALDSQERVYVADELQNGITVFDSSGRFLNKWGMFGSGAGEIDGPSGLAVDSEDNIYVVDQHNNRVQKFTSDGRYILQWGEPGDGDGELNLPWGITLDHQGNVYVADWRNDRVQKFTPDGEFISNFGESGDGDGQLNRPSNVAVDRDGNMYIADWGNERVQVLGPDGGFLLKLRGQATTSKWADEYFAANPDERSARAVSNLVPELPAHLRSPYHTSSQSEPYFWGPVAVTLDNVGRLYVVEHSRHRLQVYQTV